MSEESAQPAMIIVDHFLQASLLTTIGDDERRYGSLALTVQDLVEKYSKSPSKLSAFSRVAIQPQPNEDEPIFEEVYAAMKIHWKLIDNVYTQERPMTVLRAVMLQVVSEVSELSERLASIIYHSNVSSFLQYGYSQAELPIIQKLIEKAGKAAEFYGDQAFKNENEETALPEVSLAAPTKVDVDVASLQDGLFAAVGPNNKQGAAPKTTPANPNWPSANNIWAYEYPPIAAPVIASAISGAVRSALTSFATSTSKSMNSSLRVLFEGTQYAAQTLPRDLSVLWWMQALYSPAMRRSYRDMDVAAAAFQMPYDLAALNVIPCPESVIHILGEAMRNAALDQPEEQRVAAPLSIWLDRLRTSDVRPSLLTSAGKYPYLSRSTSLLSTARLAVHGGTSPARTLGSLAEAMVTPRQLAMWLFRDLVAEHLAETP